MYPELWLLDPARERQREMREFAGRSARRGTGEEYFASDPRPRQVHKVHLYVGNPLRLLCYRAGPHTVPDTRARD